MANRLEWYLDLKGVQQATQQLRTMDRVATSLGAKLAMIGGGALAAPFSPWIGSRSISSGLGIGYGGFAAIFGGIIALKMAFHTLEASAKTLADAFQRGASLYDRSAKTGIRPGALFQLEAGLKAGGVSPDVAERMMAQFRFMRGGARMNVAGMALGAGGAIDRATLNQILNERGVISGVANSPQTRHQAEVMDRTADAFKRIEVISQMIKGEWELLWVIIGEKVYKALLGALYVVDRLMVRFNSLLEDTDSIGKSIQGVFDTINLKIQSVGQTFLKMLDEVKRKLLTLPLTIAEQVGAGVGGAMQSVGGAVANAPNAVGGGIAAAGPLATIGRIFDFFKKMGDFAESKIKIPPSADFKLLAPPAGQRPPPAMLERIGFVLGAGSHNPAQQTANNTRQLVHLTSKLVTAVVHGWPMSSPTSLSHPVGNPSLAR